VDGDLEAARVRSELGRRTTVEIVDDEPRYELDAHGNAIPPSQADALRAIQLPSYRRRLSDALRRALLTATKAAHALAAAFSAAFGPPPARIEAEAGPLEPVAVEDRGPPGASLRAQPITPHAPPARPDSSRYVHFAVRALVG
jgi:hypothetical protein